MRFHVEVWHPTTRKVLGIFDKSEKYLGSTYEIEIEAQLWQVCEWAAKHGFEARVFRLEG